MAHTIFMENDRVRVIQYKTGAGEASDMHKHPASIVLPTTGGTFRITTAGGEATELKMEAGRPFFLEAAEHKSENIGSEAAGFVVELK